MTEHDFKILDFDSLQKKDVLTFYAFFDKKANKSLPPFLSISDIDAKRQASSIVNFSNSLICKFPNDYDLYKIGLFDENTGSLYGQKKVFITNCSDLKTKNSLAYDELLKEVESQKAILSNLLTEYNNTHSEYVKEIAILKERNNISKTNPNKSVELYSPQTKVAKKSFFKHIFN